jgi:hypothetical protein
LIEHKCHGASFTTLRNNEVSNAILMDPNTRNTDAFFRFVIVGRADCLPTPANLRRWFQDQQVERCQRCQENKTPTFAHISHECRANFQLMTQRHNALASIVRQAINKHLERDIRSDIRDNKTLNEQRPSEANRDLRPDLVFERREQARERQAEGGQANGETTLELIEFSCPYGRISHGRNTLEFTYRQKKEKYASLAEELRELRRQKVRVPAIIVS